MVQIHRIQSLFLEDSKQPAWYKLKIDLDKENIIIEVQTQLVKWLENVLLNPKFGLIDEYLKMYEINFTSPKNNKSWGFGKVVSAVKNISDVWVSYEIKIPKQTHVKQFEDVYRGVINVLASISQLILCLNGAPQSLVNNVEEKQLLIFDSYLEKSGIAGYQLSAHYAKAICEWTKQATELDLTLLAAKIDKLQSLIFPAKLGSSEFPNTSVQKINTFYLGIDIAMHVGLGPDGSVFNKNDYQNGYSVSMSNPDSAINQLILICALAILSQTVEDSKKGGSYAVFNR